MQNNRLERKLESKEVTTNQTTPLWDQYLKSLEHGFFEPTQTDKTLGYYTAALFIEHEIAPKTNLPIHLSAGPEDFRCLVPLLSLKKDGDEAIVWLRPFIHSMAMHFVMQKDQLHVLFFDPQNWEMRYYPNREFFAIIKQQFPHIKIHVLDKPVQIADVTCLLHTTNFVQCMTKPAEKRWCWIDAPTTEGQLKVGKNGTQEHAVLRITQVSDDILCFAETAEHTTGAYKLAELKQSIKSVFEKTILPNYYDKNTRQINWAKIAAVASGLSGKNLKRNHLQPSMIYPIKLTADEKSAELTLHFQNKTQMIYSNFFQFSAAIYPLQLKEKTIKQSPLFGVIDEAQQRMTMTCSSLNEMLTQINLLKTAPFMRQTFALDTWIEEVQRAIFLKLTEKFDYADIEKNGLGFEVYVNALRHLLQNHPDVILIGNFNNDDQTRELDNLLFATPANSEKIVVPFEIAKNHAILIIVYPKTKQVHYFDSLKNANKDNPTRLPLANIFLKQGYEIIFRGSHFALQSEVDSFCVIHSLKNGLIELGKEPSPAAEHVLQPTRQLVQAVLVAARLGEQINPSTQAYRNRRQKAEILLVLERMRQELGTYPNMPDALKPLADALQEELWKNLNRGKDPAYNSERKMQQNENIAGRSLASFIKSMSGARLPLLLLEEISHLDLESPTAAQEMKAVFQQVLAEDEFFQTHFPTRSPAETAFDLMGMLEGLQLTTTEEAEENLRLSNYVSEEMHANVVKFWGCAIDRDLLENFARRKLKQIIAAGNQPKTTDSRDEYFEKHLTARKLRFAPYLELSILTKQ